MAKNKEILDVLNKTKLVEISHHLGFRSWQVISKGEIVYEHSGYAPGAELELEKILSKL